MEAVTHIASAASRAIWGDQNTAEKPTTDSEPVSGQTGDVKTREPYDKGNLDSEDTKATTSTSTTTDTPTTASGSEPALKNPIRTEHENEKTGVTDLHNPTSATASDPPASSSAVGGPNTSSSSAAHTDKQGANAPYAILDSDAGKGIAETKREAEWASKIDTDGPGPKSLEEKARKGGVGGTSTSSAGNKEVDELQKESVGEGTGKKYVKSSGMAAEGGDFDATKSGAGKEADRLLEEKGVHREAAAPGGFATGTPSKKDSSSSSSPNTPETKGKKSLKEKIKEKLHKHKD